MMKEKSAHRADPKFKHKLAANKDGDSLKFCYQCGACTSVCPISKFIDIYRPNKIIELCKLGIRNLPQSNAFLFCSACTLCTKGCPQNVSVHGVMQAMKELSKDDADTMEFLKKGFEQTLESLGNEIPLPLVYSWICLRPQDEEADDIFSAEIRKSLKKALDRPYTEAPPLKPDAKRIAIIGSGPSGLTAAWDLARAGFSVTVFESLPELGGMLRTGIPEYRLPKELLDSEIDRIKAVGVKMKTNEAVDEEFFENLVDGDKFEAVFIATGAFKSRKLGVEGEDLQDVVSAIEFLKEYNLAGGAKTGKKVVVIGGGNVATDAAGAALRCGAKSVRLFCLEDKKSMPAHEWEIEEIAADGIEINPSWGVKSIVGNGQTVSGVIFKRCISVFDKNGRFAPVFDEESIKEIEADMVISAIGQYPDLSFLCGGIDSARGAVRADPYTMETNIPGIYAGGDAVSGTASLVEAITDGKTAAKSIIRYLSD